MNWNRLLLQISPASSGAGVSLSIAAIVAVLACVSNMASLPKRAPSHVAAVRSECADCATQAKPRQPKLQVELEELRGD